MTVVDTENKLKAFLKVEWQKPKISEHFKKGCANNWCMYVCVYVGVFCVFNIYIPIIKRYLFYNFVKCLKPIFVGI